MYKPLVQLVYAKKKKKNKFAKKLKKKRFCVDWFSKIVLKHIKNKLISAEEETYWELKEILLESGDLTGN